MNEQLIAAIIAAIIGFLTNVIIKKIEKTPTKVEQERTSVESAEISLKILKDTLEIVQRQNKELEAEICNYENKIRTLQNFLLSLVLDKENVKLSEEKRQEILLMMEKDA